MGDGKQIKTSLLNFLESLSVVLWAKAKQTYLYSSSSVSVYLGLGLGLGLLVFGLSSFKPSTNCLDLSPDDLDFSDPDFDLVEDV